jgi:hypothetical protein
VVTLDSFKNYHDHFKKTKYSENVMARVIQHLLRISQSALKFKSKETFTALSYFRRFYLQNSILEFDPYQIGLVCIFLAAKVEEKDVDLRVILQRLSNEE